MNTTSAEYPAQKHWLTTVMPEVIKRPIRRAWRSIQTPSPGSLLSWLVGAWHFNRRYRLGFLASYPEETAAGPLQRDEALWMFSLVRVLRPKVIVEFGFFHGHSAYNFIRAASPESHIYSYDSHPGTEATGRKMSQRHPNFALILRNQESFDPADIGRRKIDLLFIDASHDADLNIRTFRGIKNCLAERAVILIHDTGTWSKAYFGPAHWATAKASPEGWLNEDEYQHQPDERRFVNRLAEEFPEFSQLHLHSRNTIRHGITVLQRSMPLPTNEKTA